MAQATSQRSIWKGSITFGMISIPVKLFPATNAKDVAFNTLHAECKSRMKQKRWCPTCDREVAPDEVVRAYEYVKDQYIEITDADLADLPLSSLRTIDLTTFVREAEIDRMYAEKTYWLEPEAVGAKPYALLHRTLLAKGVMGLGKLAIRQKESMVSLRADKPTGALIVETMFYPDEMREIRLPELPPISEPELAMASMVVDALVEPFNADKYHDLYREALTDRIAAKSGDLIAAKMPPAADGKQPIDLMAMLKQSLADAQARKDDGTSAVPSEPETPSKEKRTRRRGAA